MTDEQFDEQIHEAYANVELSAEAEDRILANLLAAERDKGTGTLSRSTRRTRSAWRWVAPASIAAVLLIGVFVGTQLRPSYSADNTMTEPKAAGIAEYEEDSLDAGGSVMVMNGAEESAAIPAPEPSPTMMDAGEADSYRAVEDANDSFAEIVVLEDGRRFAIIDLYVPEELDPGELDWQPATIEETGDAVDVALLDEGTALVLFEGEGDLFLATAI